jgi:hypothetical protein
MFHINFTSDLAFMEYKTFLTSEVCDLDWRPAIHQAAALEVPAYLWLFNDDE